MTESQMKHLDYVESDEEDKEQMNIKDETETNLVNLRRTIYLTIMSSVDFEEAWHKLLQIKLEPGQEELCEHLGICVLNKRLSDPGMQDLFDSIFTKDNLKHTRFAINFHPFTYSNAGIYVCIIFPKQEQTRTIRIMLPFVSQVVYDVLCRMRNKLCGCWIHYMSLFSCRVRNPREWLGPLGCGRRMIRVKKLIKWLAMTTRN